MFKFLSKFFLIFLTSITIFVVFLSYYGLETNKFNDLIKNKANNVNQYVKLEFKKTKIYLNPSELNLVVKLQNPEILIKGKVIDLSELDLFLSIKSFFSSDFLLNRAEVAFKENNIKDLTKITNIFLPKFINRQLEKVFVKGNLEGKFVVPFEANGNIGKNYKFSGKISEALISLNKKLSIDNLTAEIVHLTIDEDKIFETTIRKGSIYDLELVNSIINLKIKKKEIKIESSLQTKGKINFEQIRNIASILSLNINNLKDINASIDLKNNINFDFTNRFKIKNLSYFTKGKINHLSLVAKKKKIVKKYLPDYDPNITIKNTNLKFLNTKSNHTLELEGLLKTKDNFDKFKIKENYNYNKKTNNINGYIDLTNYKVNVSQLNYKKKYGKKSELNFDINFVFDKYYNIAKLNFLSDKTKISLSNIKLNKNFEVNDLKKIEIKTFLEEFNNNDFLINKSEKLIITGKIFDASPILKSLYKKSDKKIFSKNFNSDIKVNFNKAITGTNDDVSNFAMIASINKGSYEKLSLKGSFSKNEIIEMSIYQVDQDKKTIQVISDRARPFIKNFDFIKGFEGGNLKYNSVILKNESESNLIIEDFKVSKVPTLAKLLSLASLKGIADTLSGEGIRFESFEMKSNSEGNILNIEDALAIGPAVSILLSGYVDKGKVVSLRGTLVPATKLNSIIASIPIVGDILVGKKTGEGVVGVSFKMKGPPKNIKTTVNPIKTLTPRFIVRAVEKMKKKKKEKSK